MAIPHLLELRVALWQELEEAGGLGERQDIIELLTERFHLSQHEREIRDPTGGKTFDHRVDSAVAQSRQVGWIEQVDTAGRGIWELTEIYFNDNSTLNPKQHKSTRTWSKRILDMLSYVRKVISP